MVATVVFGASPKEIAAQFVDVVANFLRKECSLRCIGHDRSDGSFDKGGLTRHRQIFGLPSLNMFRIFSTKYWYELAVRRVVKIGVPR